MKTNYQPHKYHHRGCLTYKTLKKRYYEQNKQIERLFTNIMDGERYKAAIETAPFLDRVTYMITGKTRSLTHD